MDFGLRHVKRCGIFLFFDQNGIVDDYISSMLKDLQQNMDYLLVVCNGFVNREGLDKLRSVSSEVICRANVGFDVGGYREGLFYLGWKQLEQYDEIVMLNYTIFAPLYPFKEMFDEMASRDVSFWGVTKHHKVDFDPFHAISYGYIPEHIQSHFLVLRKDLFMSYQYRDFICNMLNPKNYVESVCGYEAIFTKYFADLGFSWDVYVDTSEFEGYAYNPLMFYPKRLIKEKRCPIIKRRSFFTDYSDFLLNTCGEPSAEAYDYLKNEMRYHMDPIWNNLLRVENMAAVHRCLHLNYMLESYATPHSWKKKTAAAVLIDSSARCLWYQRYLKDLPEETDLYLFGRREDCEKVRRICRKPENVQIYDRTDENYVQLLLGAADELKKHAYAYVGIARMMDVEQEKPYSNAVSWQYSDWGNLFYNTNTVGNLLEAFENNTRMGMCIPPIPQFGRFQAELGDGWCNKQDDMNHLLRERGVFVNLNPAENPLTPIGGSFWIKGELIGELNHYLTELQEREALLALPFVVQQLGYYTGIGYSDVCSSAAITNADYMLRENNKTLFRKYGANVHPVVVERIRTGNFENGEEL